MILCIKVNILLNILYKGEHVIKYLNTDFGPYLILIMGQNNKNYICLPKISCPLKRFFTYVESLDKGHFNPVKATFSTEAYLKMIFVSPQFDASNNSI